AVAFWFKPDANLTSEERLLGTSDNWEVRTDSYGYLVADLGAAGVYNFETDDYANSAGQWHHIVAYYDSDGNVYELYGDGSLLASGALSLANQSAGTLTFGARNGSTQRFTGTLDDIRIYNRRVSADEVLDLYNGTTGSTGLRIMRWVEVR
ncbi:MAG: LamG domain-containing protein, partial [Planctomycetota bacterium]